MTTANTSTAAAQKTLKLADLEAAVEKLRGIPPSRWMLVAPDGRVWTETDPIKLVAIISASRYGFSLGEPT